MTGFRRKTLTFGTVLRAGWLSIGLAVAALLGTGDVLAAAKTTLVLGLDTSDTITLDPARASQYSPPMTLKAAYETLVTMTPGDYVTVKPQLATAWARTPDGKGFRFTLRKDVKFASGNPMTADDVKWSLDRVINLKDQPSQYVAHVDRVEIVDPMTVDVILKDPTQPILTILAAPAFSIYDRKLLGQHGGNAGPGAKDDDKATDWLNQNSAGSGPYLLKGWEQNQTIQLVRNPNYWNGKPGFERVVIRHISDSAAQLLAVRRGDVDVAFNLIPEQIATLKDNKDIAIKSETSLDFVYMAVTQNPLLNDALAKKEARQAIGYAIDYDGIRNSMLGGSAIRPVSFLPVGVNGSTSELTKEIGFHQDLDKSRALLKQAGLPDGFSFDLSYGNASIVGISYQLLAQKVQADLGRVGIKVNLNPMDQVNLRTQYTTNKSVSVLTFWNPPAVENQLWASATVERVAKRVGWVPSPEVKDLVNRAAGEEDQKKAADLWKEYQRVMVDQANLIIFVQPIYQVAMRKTVADFHLTGAGWIADLDTAKPAS
jgi:peptide/nickel transport system substrate-binding protein